MCQLPPGRPIGLLPLCRCALALACAASALRRISPISRTTGWVSRLSSVNSPRRDRFHALSSGSGRSESLRNEGSISRPTVSMPSFYQTGVTETVGRETWKAPFAPSSSAVLKTDADAGRYAWYSFRCCRLVRRFRGSQEPGPEKGGPGGSRTRGGVGCVPLLLDGFGGGRGSRREAPNRPGARRRAPSPVSCGVREFRSHGKGPQLREEPRAGDARR